MENKILLVDADFYKDIADELVRGAVGQLEERNLIEMLILDETDEMLNKGFKDQVYDIFRPLITYSPPNMAVSMLLLIATSAGWLLSGPSC